MLVLSRRCHRSQRAQSIFTVSLRRDAHTTSPAEKALMGFWDKRSKNGNAATALSVASRFWRAATAATMYH